MYSVISLVSDIFVVKFSVVHLFIVLAFSIMRFAF